MLSKTVPPAPIPTGDSGAFQRTSSLVWRLDNEGIIRWVQGSGNPGEGFSAPEIVGRSAFSVFAEHPQLLDQICRALSGTQAEAEVILGDVTWLGVFYPMPSAEGEKNEVLCVLEDGSLKDRLWLQEALMETASTLREARSHEEMPPRIARQLQDRLKVDLIAVTLGSPPEQPYQLDFTWGDWSLVPEPKKPVRDMFTDAGLIGNLNGRCLLLEEYTSSDPGACHLYGSALYAQDENLGALWLGRKVPLSEVEKELVHAMGEMAASAIQRQRGHELTRRRLERIAALRSIDQAISGSFNLNLTLHIILEQVMSQLEVDAADIHLYDPDTLETTYAEGLGFEQYQPQSGISSHRVKLIQKVLLGRELVALPDLARDRPEVMQSGVFSLEKFRSYYGVPLIAKGIIIGVLEVFHRTPLQVDREWYEFLRTLGTQAAIAMDNAALVENLRRTNLMLDQAYNTTLEGWVRALDLRDECTGEHTQRVVERAVKLAQAMGIPQRQLVHIRRGALLHDIGKLGVPDRILNKKGPLTDQEWDLMRKHPLYAREMLEPIEFLHPALPIPTAHHEKWDGSGYPSGLIGAQIPLEARVFAVIDVWDALSSPRPYREAWPAGKIHNYIREQAGVHFDPQVVAMWDRVFEIR
jgi:GAF domain-containing protein